MGYKVALGEICSFSRGASIPRARMLDRGDYLYIHYGDLYKGFDVRIDVENPQKPIPYIADSEPIREGQRLSDQDIVYVLTSETVEDLGHAFLFNNPRKLPAVAGTETTIVHVNRPDLVLPSYLNWLFQSSRFKRLLRQYVKGMKVFRVHPDDLARIEIEIPSIDDQRRIVSILDAIFERSLINSQINGYLEELLLARYDELFGLFDSSACNGKLADIGEVIGGATPSKKRADYYSRDGIGWITPRDLSNTNKKFIAHGADDITQAGYDSCSARLLRKGSVLFSSRAPIGYVAIADDELVTNQGFKSVVPKPEVGTAFVYCFLKRSARRIADMGAGTTFPEVSGKMMKAVELKLPELETCKSFSAFAKPLLHMQRKCEAENTELESLRDALLPRLMSGEIDVSKVGLTQLNSHLSGC